MRLDCGRALLEMVLPNHQELSFEEVCQTVEKESSKLKLEMDAHGEGPQCKGRYLVASCALKAGDVILSELPLFEGNTDAKKSEKVSQFCMKVWFSFGELWSLWLNILYMYTVTVYRCTSS